MVPVGMKQRYRVFLSAVSSEFRRAREAVASDLRARGLEVKEQRDFRQEGDAPTTLHKLHDDIRDCAAVVCVVGMRSGAGLWHPPLPCGNRRFSP